MVGRPRSAQVDESLLKAALAIFVERGFHGVALDEVARRAGVSRTALYRRWSDREALLSDALRHWRAVYGGGLHNRTMPLPQLIDLLATRACAALEDAFTRSLLRRLFSLPPDAYPILGAYLDGDVAAGRNQLTHAIHQAQREGTVDSAVDPELAQDGIAGALLYKLLSGAADRPGFDVTGYVLRLFAAAGLREIGQDGPDGHVPGSR